MKERGVQQSTGRKIAVGSVAAATAVGLTLLTTSPGSADEQNPIEYSEAYGQVLDADILTAEAVDALSAYSSSPSSTEADSTPINAEVLQAIGVEVPGIGVPLISNEGGEGLLELGEVGVLNAYGHAPADNTATASAGAVGEDGGLNLDDINSGQYGNAKVDLTSVLRQLDLDGVTDQVVDELSLELGAIASTANSNGEANDSEYVVADGILTVSSPAVGELSGALDEAVDGAGGTLEEVIGEEGLVNELAGLDLSLSVGPASVDIGGSGTQVSVEVRDALNSVVENVVNEALEDEAGIVSIDLANGDIKIDLAKIVKGADASDLNGLDPNTQVLTSDTISKITDAVAGALGTLSGKVNETLTDALNDVHLVIEFPASISAFGIPAVDGKVTVDATLGQLAGTDDTDPTVSTDLSLAGVPVGSVLNAITQPVITALLGITEPLIGGILESTADEVSGAVTGLVDPVLTSLDPVFGALNQVVDVTINEQPTLKDPAEESQVEGDNGPGFTVSAVSLELLPAADAIDINLASSSVRATADTGGPDPDANANAAAAASASADADGDNDPAAQAASEAAADDDADTTASAAADENAEAAAESAATADASSEASADSTSDENASSTAASQAAAQADNSDDTNAEASTATDANSAAASEAASTADSSNEASAEAAADSDASAATDPDAADEADATDNVNAAASASASASADDDGNAVAEAAAQAAADDDANSAASAAANEDAQAAAESAANEEASSETSADASADPNASAQDAANAAADADNSDSTNADASSASDANAAAAASAASTADSSSEASATAAADGDEASATSAADGDEASAAADGADANDSANGDEASASSAADSDQATADSDQASSANAGSSDGSSSGSSTNASGSSDGGNLPRTGADGIPAMVGFAALLLVGGAAAVWATRRLRSRSGL